MKEYIEEYGCTSQFRLPDAAYMRDENGEIVTCACGNPADRVIIGLEAYVARCSECLYGKEHEKTQSQ